MPCLVTVGLASKTGLPEDKVIFDYVFDLDPTVGANRTTILDGLADFFHSGIANGPFDGIDELLSGELSRTVNPQVSFYNLAGHLDGSNHGSPVAVTTLANLGASEALQGLPGEVAIVLSMHGDLTDVPEKEANPAYPPVLPKFFRPAARRRGRLFVGPLAVSALADDGGVCRVNINARGTIEDGASALRAAVPSWSVWSRADGAVYPIEGGWVDDAFDTQRRRGTVATVRNFWV